MGQRVDNGEEIGGCWSRTRPTRLLQRCNPRRPWLPASDNFLSFPAGCAGSTPLQACLSHGRCPLDVSREKDKKTGRVRAVRSAVFCKLASTTHHDDVRAQKLRPDHATTAASRSRRPGQTHHAPSPAATASLRFMATQTSLRSCMNIDSVIKYTTDQGSATPPSLEPGLLPNALHEQNDNV